MMGEKLKIMSEFWPEFWSILAWLFICFSAIAALAFHTMRGSKAHYARETLEIAAEKKAQEARLTEYLTEQREKRRLHGSS